MLVGEKFIYINLPRCASTSFYISCLKNNISVNHLNNNFDEQHLKFGNLHEIDNEKLADSLFHPHESINSLKKKFGDDIEVISVNRDRHERFISLWKHIIDEFHRMGENDTFQKCSQLEIKDILFFKSKNISDLWNIENTINEFCDMNNIKLSEYGRNMMQILYRPFSDYHLHLPDIIWFDFKKLNELEDWVSQKLKINFKLEKINSSQHFESKVKNNDDFKSLYNSIYDIFDIVKKQKTLI